MDSQSITVHLPLTDILPRKDRRQRTKKLEKHLGFKLNILRPPKMVTSILLLSIITSIVLLFFIWPIGLSVLVISAAGLKFANKFGKELDLTTLGQLAEKITRENYLKSRRNPSTVNKKEIEKVLMDWFSDEFYLDKTKLTRDAKFV